MNNFEKFLVEKLLEGKQKQARIKSDIEKTRVGATGSNEPSDPRYSRAMTSLHNSPENMKRRKESVKSSQRKRGREKAWAWAQGRGPFPFKGVHEGQSHITTSDKKTRPAGHAATERPGEDRIKAMQAKVAAHYKKVKSEHEFVGPKGGERVKEREPTGYDRFKVVKDPLKGKKLSKEPRSEGEQSAEIKVAKDYLNKGSNWVDQTARKKYPRGTRR